MNEKILEMLKLARQNQKFKQQEVADKMGLKTGGTISNWESGKTEPTIDEFVELCRIYGVDYAEILIAAYGDPVNDDADERNFSLENELLEKFRELDEIDKGKVIGYMEGLQSKKTLQRKSFKEVGAG